MGEMRMMWDSISSYVNLIGVVSPSLSEGKNNPNYGSVNFVTPRLPARIKDQDRHQRCEHARGARPVVVATEVRINPNPIIFRSEFQVVPPCTEQGILLDLICTVTQSVSAGL